MFQVLESCKKLNLKLSKLVTADFVRFCASIVYAFILGVELFDYVVDGVGWGRESARAWLGGGGGESQMGDITSRCGEANPQDAITIFSLVLYFFMTTLLWPFFPNHLTWFHICMSCHHLFYLKRWYGNIGISVHFLRFHINSRCLDWNIYLVTWNLYGRRWFHWLPLSVNLWKY